VNWMIYGYFFSGLFLSFHGVMEVLQCR